ncbi:RNA methyltransferase [Flavicella sp.]|uniref:TrmH family RNA methyltransferase n=1 Tax=Flavicella sp. TaxID=2957742 RepID=UPI00262E481D|nr:RNA methyltransferase [Flavicella sp.]MDG1804911.1 RNA methyltransferase [Flavicella sp.]
MHKKISSLQNPLIKELVQLKEKSRVRKKSGTFLLEGQREIELATLGTYTIEKIIYCSQISSMEKIELLESNLDSSIEFLEVSKEVYQKIAYRETTEGILAVVNAKKHELENISFKREKPLLLIAEAPEKPGNIGALLRTADAANVDAVLIANPKTDLYNPNIIRSSVGCLFTTQIATGTTDEILAYLKKHNITSYAAALKDDSEPYQEQDYKKASAIVVGTEATGLSDQWLYNASKKIIIPMNGKIDSMNVSVAASILIFEASRQRNFN